MDERGHDIMRMIAIKLSVQFNYFWESCHTLYFE